MDKLLVSCRETSSYCQNVNGEACTRERTGNDVIITNITNVSHINKVPKWLNVQLVRLGPAKWDFDDDNDSNGSGADPHCQLNNKANSSRFTLNHWLDGCAMLCRFTITDQTLSYSSRFLRSDAYRKMIQIKRPVYTEFGTRSFPDPCKNVFSRFFSQLVPSDLTDNGTVNVFKLSNEYYSSSETCNIWKVCPFTLKAQKKINMDKIVGVNLCCSHVQYMPGDSYAYNMTSSFLTGMKYHLVKIPLFQQDNNNNTKKSNNNNNSNNGNNGNNNNHPNDEPKKSLLESAKILTTISSSWSTCIAYYHSFGLTRNYVIFIELPLLVNGFKLATCTPKGRPLKDCFEWHPNEKTTFYVICKQSGTIIKKFISAAFFYFHIINCYEDDAHLVVDLMAYSDASILDKWDLHKMRSNIYEDQSKATPKRFVLPIYVDEEQAMVGQNLVKLSYTKATAVIQQQEGGGKGNVIMLTGESLSKHSGFELPTINYHHFNGKPYKYCYGSGVFEKGQFANSILKLNVQDQTYKCWKESDDLYPGECIFVARPGSQEEDDGVVLCVVLSSNQHKPHFMLILDGKSFQEIGRANIAKGSGIIPPTIHGVYDYIDPY